MAIVMPSMFFFVLMVVLVGDAATARNGKIFGLTRYCIRVAQGFKDQNHRGRRAIETKPNPSPRAGINKEIQEQSDASPSNALPKAMGPVAVAPIGEGTASEFAQGFKDQNHRGRRAIETKPNPSPRAGINKEIQEQSDASPSNALPKAMGPVAVAPIGEGTASEFAQGFKDQNHRGRRAIETMPNPSPRAGINKEIQEQSDASPSNGLPKAMGQERRN
ncbi:hypothetical protein GH714_025264 [Hevea brasiliensis]|uniref:DUF4057 domain-containing protein n=1 Tax=Hevea brasiliensis TaxID=3981 RepID=A0A6A6M5F6_HEVBR|nr:hypothetical protein GH714_025264 [Hevea brasiliensis]